ncbi:MAG: zinc-ribbon domain-containing protein [Firmicutes bacterium]|nr:zinc-ribbon domain-containing protein [Bacillota bacterium]
MAFYCRHCGAQIPEGNRFCHVCGTPVLQPAYPPMPQPPYQEPPRKRKTIFQRAWFWILLCLVVVVVIVIWPRSGNVTERDESSGYHSSRESGSEASRHEESSAVQPKEESHSSFSEEVSSEESSTTEAVLPDIPAYTIPDTEYGYYGSRLSEAGKRAYAQFVIELDQLETTLTFYQIEVPEIEQAYTAIHEDHPEFFWITGAYQWESTTTDSLITVKFTVSTVVPIEEVGPMRTAAVSVCQSLADQTLELSDYETALFFHDYIVQATIYDYDLADQFDSVNTLETIDGNAYGVLVEHMAICEGYARAFEWLMKERGIPCRLVKGYDINEYPDGIGHTWNIVTLGGDDYYIDVTWDDQPYPDGTEGLVHDYFCITTEELLDTHIITDPDQYPPCTATEYDYFRMNGYYVGSYDYSRVADALYIQNGGFYYLKFDSAGLCTEAIDILVSGGVFRDMEGITSAYLYRTSLNGRILTIEIMYE